MGRTRSHPRGVPAARPAARPFDADALTVLARHTDNAVVVTDAKGRIVWVNAGFVRLTGYRLKAVLGRYLDFLHGPGTHEATERHIRQRMARRQGFHAEVLNYTKSGREFWVELEVQPVFDAAGRLTHFVSIQRDITVGKNLERELRESQRAVTTLLSSLPGMAYRCRNDRDWTLEFASRGCRALTGYPPEDLVSNRKLSYNDLIHPADRQMVRNKIRAAVRAKEPYRLTYRIRTAAGEEKWVSEQGVAVPAAQGKSRVLEGFISDVTDRKRAEEALAGERELLQALLDNIPDVIFIKDAKSRFLMVNLAKARRLGVSKPEDVAGHTDADFYPAALAAECLREERRVIRTGKALIGKVELRQSRPGEPESWVLVNKVPFRDRDGRIQGLVGVSRDITELKNMERRLAQANVRLEELACTDPLTGLLNRRVILEMAENEWERWRRYGGAFSLLIIDVDDFKSVNDTHGHLVGDQALRHLTTCLARSLRSVDVVGRYGGEEFIALLPATRLEGAAAVADKVLRNVRETPLAVDGARIELTVSVGLASARREDPNLDALLQRADRALYKAKHLGKNQVALDGQPEPRLFAP